VNLVNLVILVGAETAVESPPRRAALYLTQRVSGT
jgi:hypothetical protein